MRVSSAGEAEPVNAKRARGVRSRKLRSTGNSAGSRWASSMTITGFSVGTKSGSPVKCARSVASSRSKCAYDGKASRASVDLPI